MTQIGLVEFTSAARADGPALYRERRSLGRIERGAEMIRSVWNPLKLRTFAAAKPALADRWEEDPRWDALHQIRAMEECVPLLVAEQARATPEAPAIIDGRNILSYRQLNFSADHLAQHLRCLGVGTEVLVGLCLERSVAMIVGALGILKAGGAFLPLYPACPKDRLAWMLKDAKPEVLVTQSKISHGLPEEKWKLLHLDSKGEPASGFSLTFAGAATSPGADLKSVTRPQPVFEILPDHLAYVIYTSGSAGTPKGV